VVVDRRGVLERSAGDVEQIVDERPTDRVDGTGDARVQGAFGKLGHEMAASVGGLRVLAPHNTATALGRSRQTVTRCNCYLVVTVTRPEPSLLACSGRFHTRDLAHDHQV